MKISYIKPYVGYFSCENRHNCINSYICAQICLLYEYYHSLPPRLHYFTIVQRGVYFGIMLIVLVFFLFFFFVCVCVPDDSKCSEEFLCDVQPGTQYWDGQWYIHTWPAAAAAYEYIYIWLLWFDLINLMKLAYLGLAITWITYVMYVPEGEGKREGRHFQQANVHRRPGVRRSSLLPSSVWCSLFRTLFPLPPLPSLVLFFAWISSLL